jgi:hypothetical protein
MRPVKPSSRMCRRAWRSITRSTHAIPE